MGGMHDFKPFLGGKIMHTTEKIAKNHAYRHKRYRGAAKITHTTAFDAAMFWSSKIVILSASFMPPCRVGCFHCDCAASGCCTNRMRIDRYWSKVPLLSCTCAGILLPL